jgi:hypothetical protein
VRLPAAVPPAGSHHPGVCQRDLQRTLHARREREECTEADSQVRMVEVSSKVMIIFHHLVHEGSAPTEYASLSRSFATETRPHRLTSLCNSTALR